MDTGLPELEYARLPQDSEAFRLFKLDGVDQATGVITGSLHVFEIQQSPAYKALSYTWDDPMIPSDMTVEESGTQPLLWIQCDSSRLPVKQNLRDALLQFAEGNEVGFWWIDAICINQSSIGERNHQVALMAAIYSQADHVLVWLGREDDVAKDWYMCINTFQKLALNYALLGIDLTTPRFDDGLSPPEPSLIKSWAEFYRRRWFGRVWVLQELALAKEVSVRCGRYHLPWLALSLVSVLLVQPEWRKLYIHHIKDDSTYQVATTAPSLATQLSLMCSGDPYTEGEITSRLQKRNGNASAASLLLSLLEQTANFHATDPRDKVYGILGMFERLAGNRIKDIIPIEYETSPQRIYQRVAEYLILSVPILHILSYVRVARSESFANMPSWIPDFEGFYATGGQGPLACLPESSFAVTKCLGGVPPRSIAGEKLILRAYLVDEAVEVADRDIPFNAVSYTAKSLRLCASLTGKYRTGEPRLEVFWRSIIANSDEEGGPISPGYGQLFLDWVTFCLIAAAKESRSAAAEPLVSSPFSPEMSLGALFPPTPELPEVYVPNYSAAQAMLDALESIRFDLSAEEDDPFINQLEARIIQAKRVMGMVEYVLELERVAPGQELFTRSSKIKDRELFRTRTNYLGLGPPSIQAGDEVWVLQNARVPFVLRRVPGTSNYRLVGECYVHGIMHGELEKDGHFDFQEISIA